MDEKPESGSARAARCIFNDTAGRYLHVPGLCHGGPGKGAGKRCKWLITKPLEHPSTAWKSACRQFDSVPGHHSI